MKSQVEIMLSLENILTRVRILILMCVVLMRLLTSVETL